MSLIVISISGDAYTRGFPHGPRPRGSSRITYHIASTFGSPTRASMGVRIGAGSEFIPAIEGYDRMMMEEVHGIADGAGVSL